jgi:cytochrome P450
MFHKLQEEIDGFYERNGLPEPISYTETQQMPYLQAVVKEATRLLPSIVYQLLRYAPEGLAVDGKRIPAGTPIGVSPLAQNRDKAIWGPDADDFKPERWLEDEARTRYLDAANMTFGGSGPRMCIGRNIALVGHLQPLPQPAILRLIADTIARLRFTSL